MASCQAIEYNNDLLTEEKSIGLLIHTNEAYAYVLYTRMCVYEYAYVRISIRVYAYWADANYAYILVRIHLSCTVINTQKVKELSRELKNKKPFA